MNWKIFNMGLLSIMDRKAGDFSHKWDATDKNQVENAREMFKQLVGKQKMLAYKTGYRHDGVDACLHCNGTGSQSGQPVLNERITEFDPKVCEIVFVPQMTGG